MNVVYWHSLLAAQATILTSVGSMPYFNSTLVEYLVANAMGCSI